MDITNQEFDVSYNGEEPAVDDISLEIPKEFDFDMFETDPQNLPESFVQFRKDRINLFLDTPVENNTFVTDGAEIVRQNNLVNFFTGVKLDVVNKLAVEPVDSVVLNIDPPKVASERHDLEVTLSPEAAAAIYKSDEDNIFKNSDKQVQHRVEVMRQIFAEQFQSSDSGVFNGFGHFLDLMLSFPKDVLGGGGFDRNSKVKELFQLASDPSVSMEEFQDRVKQIAKDVADTGFFSDNNWFYTGQMIADVFEGEGKLDAIMTVLDVAGMGSLVKGVSKGGKVVLSPLTKLRTSDDIAAATADNAKVAAGIDKKMMSGEVTEAPMTLSPASERPMSTSFTDGFFSVPARAKLVGTELMWRISELLTKKDFGFFIQEDVWKAIEPVKRQEILERAQALGSNRLIDHNVVRGEDRLFNPLGVAIYGTTKGKYYPKNFKHKAQAFADEIGGEVIPVMDEGVQKWAVRKQWNIATDDLYDPIKESELLTSWFQTMGSTYLTTSQRLDRIAKRGESQLAGTFQEIFSDYNKVRKSISNETRNFLDNVYTSLRDGVEAERRTPLTVREFKDRFFKEFGKPASQKDIDYFVTVENINNTAYLLLADTYFKRVVNAEGRVFTNVDGISSIVFPASKVPPSNKGVIKAWDVDNGRIVDIPADDLTGFHYVHEGYKVGDTTFEYIYTTSNKFRRVYHNDVLGYNVGGPRVYDEHKWFVGQENEVLLGGRTTPTKIEKNFLGARTEKEATKAVDEINDLFTYLRAKVVPSGSKFNDIQRIRRLAGDVDVETKIAKTTLWNKNIDSVDDLANFLEKYGVDYSKNVSLKSNGNRLTNDLDFFAQGTGIDNGADFLRRSSFRTRSDVPLLGYGGEKSSTLPPHVAIERNFTRQLTNQANAAYMKNAVEGWIAGASEAGVLKKIENTGNKLADLLNAEVDVTKAVGRKFEQERRVIRRRLANQDAATKAWQSMVGRLSDWVYDKGHKRMGINIENWFSENPLHFMRSIAFHSKLGLFAFDQLIVQSNQAVNIAAIGGVNGFRGVTLAFPLQFAMYNGTSNVAKYIGKKVSGLTGLKAEEFEELVEFMKQSGRFAVGREVAEQDMNYRLAQSTISKGLEYGRFFFNQGERFARMSAAATAYLNFKKQFKTAKLVGNERATLWMTEEMDRLTAGMTTMSGTSWQRNSLSAVPLQFMTYTARMMEQMLSGRILSRGERLRLGVAQTFFWGLTGVGIGFAADWVIGEEGLSPNEYTALRYGALDWIIGFTGEARTAWAQRLAFPGAITELWEDVTEGEFLKVVSGPSGTIAKDIIGDIITLGGDMLHGRYAMAESDFATLSKNLAVVNRLARSYYLFNVGKYYSRRGSEVADDFSKLEAVMNLLGAPLQKVDLTYEIFKDERDRKAALDDIGRLVQDKMTQAVTRIANGDRDSGISLMQEAASLITVFEDPKDIMYLRKYLDPQLLNMLETAIRRKIEAGRDNEVKHILEG